MQHAQVAGRQDGTGGGGAGRGHGHAAAQDEREGDQICEFSQIYFDEDGRGGHGGRVLINIAAVRFGEAQGEAELGAAPRATRGRGRGL